MVSFTLKVILHITEKDSKYRDVAPLIFGVFRFFLQALNRHALLQCVGSDYVEKELVSI